MSVDLVNDDFPGEEVPRGEVRRIIGAPVEYVLPNDLARAEKFAEDKLATNPYRLGHEKARNYARSLIDGTLAEMYVARLLDLGEPDLSIHDGNHGADVGAYQVKATNFDRWAKGRRSFVFYPEALASKTGTVLGLAYRGILNSSNGGSRRYRLLFAFTYDDARTLARDPFTSVGRARGARAVYVEDLDRVAEPVCFGGSDWRALVAGGRCR